MKTIHYFSGLLVATVVILFAFIQPDYESRPFLHSAEVAMSYIAYSTLAFILTRFGNEKKTKAWLYFVSGCVMMFFYIPALSSILSWFYVPYDYNDEGYLRSMTQIYFYAPLIVSALCVFRGISFWVDESMKPKLPNQPVETTEPVARPPRLT